MEVRNNYAHVTTQRILNKFIEIHFSVGCMVWPWCCLFQDWLPVKILMKIYLYDLYSLFGIFFFLVCWSIHCSHRFSMWKLIKDSRFKVSQPLKTFTSIDKSHVLQKCRETSSNKCNSEIRQNLYTVFPRIVSAETILFWIQPYVLWPFITVHTRAETIQGRKLFTEIRYVYPTFQFRL